MTGSDIYHSILAELGKTLSSLDPEVLDRFTLALIQANHVFVAGAGRSGLMIKAFAMRLMHLGLVVYVVGETTTPGILPGDLLVIASGSGETGSMVTHASSAKRQGARTALITIYCESTIGKMADIVISVQAPTTKIKKTNADRFSIQPMGSLFEQSVLLLCDGVILKLISESPVSSEQMMKAHANLE